MLPPSYDAGLSVRPLDEFEEAAFLAVGGFILMKKRQLSVIKGLEERVPVYVFQLIGMAELGPQDTFAVLALGSSDHSWTAGPALHPRPDRIAISGGG